MQNGIVQSIILIGVAQSFFLLFLYLKKGRPGRASRLYFYLVLAVALGLGFTYLSFSPLPPFLESLLGFNLSLNFLYGPLIYLYTAYYTGTKTSPSRWNFLHFLPFLAALILLILQSTLRGKYAGLQEILWFSAHIQGFYYGLLSISVLKRQNQTLKEFSAESYRIRFRWLFILVFMNILTWGAAIIRFVFEIYYPSVSLRMGLAAPLLGTAAVYLYGYYTLTHPQIFTEIDIGQAKMDKDSTEQELKHRLLEKMEKAHLWRRENLTLHSLSELTDIPAYKLSRIINSELESNFFTFVNRYRVEEVQKRLKEKKSPTILDAAFQSGFNSKSTFNDAFKRITGITPSQYKKKVRIQRIQ